MWSPRPNLDVALVGRNLLHPSHPEFAAYPGRSVFRRSVLLKLTMRF
jgi:iron complex outermembrane receptor protein